MTPSELADKLEQGGIFRITTEEEALRTKCVRFAADMEVLMQEHAQPWFEACVEQIEVRVTIRHEVRYFYGDSIYAAARKAVEALEEKR